jgi:hypothetical protein
MAAPLLIAAARPLWDELVAGSGLPAQMFAGQPPPDFADGTDGPFVFCGESLADSETLTVEQLEELDRLLFACREGSFAWIHRCTGDPSEEFETLMRASKAWSGLVSQRQRRYESVIRPVAVIIGGDSSSGKESDFRDFLRRFESARSDIAFRDVFIMAPRLEPAGREIFHARNIWPISVSRLLLFLSARDRRNDASTAYAWRFREFRHTDPGLLYERLVPACSDALFGKLTATGQTPNLPRWSSPEGCLALEEEKIGKPAYWHAFPAMAESEQSTNTDRILRRLAAAGEADSAKRYSSVLERWETREELIGNFWLSLHSEAGSAWLAETSLKSAERTDLAKPGESSDAHLESMPSTMEALDLAGKSLKTGAAELAAAQSWFVQRWFRLAIALTAASFLGVMFFRAAQLKFENLYMAGFIATGCFLGALAAAALFYVLETWRGGKGVEEWRQRKKRFEAALAQLNGNLVGLKSKADQLSAECANVMLHSKLLRLVSRLTGAVASVFKPSSTAVAGENHDGADQGKTAIRYLEKSTVRLGRSTTGLENETNRDLANHAVSLILGKTDFFDRLLRQWKNVCQHSDAPPKGAVDAAGLHRDFADTMLGLPSEVDRIVSEASRKSSLWADLNESLAQLKERHSDHGLLSVELSDTAQLVPFRQLLVSRAYAEESSNMQEAGALSMPPGAEATCPVLLLEFSKISTEGDLTSLGKNTEVAA